MGQHAIFAEHTAAVSSATHPCPYIAYVGPIHPSSSNSSGSVSDVSSFNSHWNGPSVPSEIPSSYAFPSMDIHYHSWEHHSPPFSTTGNRIGNADQPSAPPVAQRSARTSSDIPPRSGSLVHPFLVGHRYVRKFNFFAMKNVVKKSIILGIHLIPYRLKKQIILGIWNKYPRYFYFHFVSFRSGLYNRISCTSFSHSSSARAGSSATSSMIPPYQGSNARARDRVQALQAYYHQQQPGNSPPIHPPVISGSRRSSSHRGLSQVGPVASPSDQTGFYFIPSGASSRNFQEAENHPPTRFRSWQRDHLPPFSVSQADRDSGRSTFHQGGGGSDASIRSGSFRQRHGSERMSSQNR